jgi:hypothetical protein
VKGLLIAGLRQPKCHADAQAALQAAIGTANPRERGYIAAPSAQLNGHAFEAVSHYEMLLQANPRDLLAHLLAPFELLWVGENAWVRNLTERAASA